MGNISMGCCQRPSRLGSSSPMAGRCIHRPPAEDRPTVVVIGKPVAFRDGQYVGWSHYKVVYAYDDEEWVFVDPLAKSSVVYSYQDAESFKKQWTAMGRIIIEAWDE